MFVLYTEFCYGNLAVCLSLVALHMNRHISRFPVRNIRGSLALTEEIFERRETRERMMISYLCQFSLLSIQFSYFDYHTTRRSKIWRNPSAGQWLGYRQGSIPLPSTLQLLMKCTFAPTMRQNCTALRFYYVKIGTETASKKQALAATRVASRKPQE